MCGLLLCYLNNLSDLFTNPPFRSSIEINGHFHIELNRFRPNLAFTQILVFVNVTILVMVFAFNSFMHLLKPVQLGAICVCK